ncbi:MAG: 23S rRNA (adenine(2503)-C(2))-methyltransferase RlmN [Marinifilaceae bacterium]|jgi:23S rRNA (adenine2503-C2)-methyltransferase
MQNQGVKQDIRSVNLDELKDFLVENGEKAFRAKQVYEWLWKKNAHSFEAMKNLSKKTRDLLETHFRIQHLEVDHFQKSEDGTTKIAFRLEDGGLVEGVLIPAEKRVTACVSSQQGCKFGCRFCATGTLGFTRNLTAGEIYDQIFEIKRRAEEEFDSTLSNIVYMGMGEPLENYENVMHSIERVSADNGLMMAPRRITVSTVGLPHMIKRMADDEVRFNVALSLHSAKNEARDEIMPVNKAYDLEDLIDAIKYFNEKTGTRVTFEYLLMDKVNDSLSDARALAEFCKNFPCKVNLIEYNPNEHAPYQRSSAERRDAFLKFLEQRNMVVNLRRSRGKDIAAACGQLANKDKK